MKRAVDDSQKRVAFPVSLSTERFAEFAELERESEIHIVPTGKYEHWSGFEFEITPETIAEFIRNFNNGATKELPITAGHDNGMSGGELPAVGWFTGLTDRGVKGLYGFVRWTEEGRRLLAQKAFKYFSAEIAFDYYDLETKQKYSALLTGGALTNKPFFKQLDLDPSFGFSAEDKKVAETVLSIEVPEIITQFNDTHMNIADILAKKAKGEALTAEEITFVKSQEATLSDEDKATLSDELKDETTEEETDEEREQREGDENEAKGLNRDGSAKDEPTPEAPAVELNRGKNGQVTLSAAQFAALEANANAGATAFARLEKLELERMVGTMVLSDSNKSGRILPKQTDAVVTFLSTLDKKQRDQFVNIINNMPKAESKMFSELGDTGGTSVAALTEINEKVATLRAGDKSLSYSVALSRVLAQNPELETRYNEELAAG